MTPLCAVRRTLAAVVALTFAAALAAQQPQGQVRRAQIPDNGGRSATYDPLKTFAPYTMPLPPSGYRGGDGAPTPRIGRTAQITRCTSPSIPPPKFSPIPKPSPTQTTALKPSTASGFRLSRTHTAPTHARVRR